MAGQAGFQMANVINITSVLNNLVLEVTADQNVVVDLTALHKELVATSKILTEKVQGLVKQLQVTTTTISEMTKQKPMPHQEHQHQQRQVLIWNPNGYC